jgi:hypothetical protein
LIRPPSKPLLFGSFFGYIDVNGEVLEILVAMVKYYNDETVRS